MAWKPIEQPEHLIKANFQCECCGYAKKIYHNEKLIKISSFIVCGYCASDARAKKIPGMTKSEFYSYQRLQAIIEQLSAETYRKEHPKWSI
jgi:transcription elongation factor Elf1